MRLQPDSPHVRFNRALVLLLQGDYAGGLPLYESRLQQRTLLRFHTQLRERSTAFARIPRWRGGDTNGASLLVWSEQGLGDSVMMLRYLPLLKRRVGRVAVYCEPPLVRLFEPFASEVIPTTQLPPTGFDFQCPTMSLPLAWGTTLETIPPAPYLSVPGARDLVSGVPRPRVGICWAGNRANPDDRLRSIEFERLEPILRVPGVSFVSLQKDERATAFSLVDRMDECKDLADTAALIQELDLVISVDSVVAHLAGALGKPVWLLNRFATDWRWQVDHERTPWYSTMRILRQRKAGDWDDVVGRAAADLPEALRPTTSGLGPGG